LKCIWSLRGVVAYPLKSCRGCGCADAMNWWYSWLGVPTTDTTRDESE
jgi:hypothetical protein